MALRKIILSAAAVPLGWLLTPGCETYDSPPRPVIEGVVDGVLGDPQLPVVVRFSEPIAPDTLRIQLIKLETDLEGRLFDEDDDPNTVVNALFSFDPVTANNFGGVGELIDDNSAYRITLDLPPPVGPSLAVVIEAGLTDVDGNDWAVRQVLPFGYALSCDGSSGGTDKFPSGAYFFVVDVEKPIQVQIQLWAQIEVDAATGKFVGQFTNADRNPDGSRCDPPCADTEACRLLPAEECVLPSTKAGNADEFSDFVPNDVLPVGYSFFAEGCVIENGEEVVFVNLPADVDIQQPDVLVQGIQLTSSFGDDGTGVFMGTGAVTADTVFIGTSDSGGATGTLVARLVDAAEAPPGIPGPP